MELMTILQGPASGKFKSQANYNSAFKYTNHNHVSVRMEDEGDVLARKVSDVSVSTIRIDATNFKAALFSQVQPSWGFYMTTYTFTFLSYVIFILTLPFTYWFFVKKLGEFDRLVVFRLGKMLGNSTNRKF